MRKLIGLVTLTLFTALSFLPVGAAKAQIAPVECKSMKCDNFLFFVDHSGSMSMMSSKLKKDKIVVAKDQLLKMNQAIPNLPYNGAFYTTAPFKKYVEFGKYDRAKMDAAIKPLKVDFDVFGRLTPLGDGLTEIDAVLSKMGGNCINMILMTDGENNLGSDPVAAAKALYAKYPGKLYIHIVSFADTKDGKAVLDSIAALNKDAQYVQAESLLSDMAIKAFVEKVFCGAAAAPAADRIILRGINFDFDKYNIRKDMEPILDAAADVLKKRADIKVTVEGHTDSMGTDAYNQKLSERRANAVKAYLVKKGVASERMSPIGFGEAKPVADNKTEEGRFKNRRVEFNVK